MATHGKGSVASVALLLVLLLAIATVEVVPVEARALDDDVEQTPQESNDMAPLISDFREAACKSAVLLCEGGNARICKGFGDICTDDKECCSNKCDKAGDDFKRCLQPNALTCRANGTKCKTNQSCCSGHCSWSGGYVCKDRTALQ